MSGRSQLRLGTRGSLLALWQARWVQARLGEVWPGGRVSLVSIRTTGDRVLDRPLADIGGKGLFTRELDEALLGGDIDLAVHSLKDLPFRLPPGITTEAFLPRADPRDALVSHGVLLKDLPAGARIGTSSLRRRAQLLNRHSHLRMEDLRGNVDTRLRKLESGEYDGIVLSAAGLIRLEYGSRITEYIDADVVMPAVGQGTVVVVCREHDTGTRSLLARLDDIDSRQVSLAERALLEVLEGNCQVPIGGYATIRGALLSLDGLVASPNGETIVRDHATGPSSVPVQLGRQLGQSLLDAGAAGILNPRHES